MDRKEAAKEILRTVTNLYSKKPTLEVQNSSRGETMLLHLVSLHPEGITPGQLRDLMEVSSARIAAILGALESKGMLERRMDEKDRRRIQVFLTPVGTQRARQDGACVLSHVEHCLSVLDDEEIAGCIRVLHKLEVLHSEKEVLCENC